MRGPAASGAASEGWAACREPNPVYFCQHCLSGIIPSPFFALCGTRLLSGSYLHRSKPCQGACKQPGETVWCWELSRGISRAPSGCDASSLFASPRVLPSQQCGLQPVSGGFLLRKRARCSGLCAQRAHAEGSAWEDAAARGV